MQTVTKESLHVPEFGENFCPPIYPLGDQQWQFSVGVPLICLHSLQINPSPAPSFASQTVVDCQPIMITLQEESCLRLASFLADGIVVTHGDVLPDFSVNSIVFTLKEFDLIVPLSAGKKVDLSENGNHCSHASFSGARLHVEDLYFSQSPSLKCNFLNLDKDPACFSLWGYQPIDASQRKWTTRSSHLSLSLETFSALTDQKGSADWSAGLWKCIELREACFEAAMVTADGSPLFNVSPSGGVVRIGVACEQFSSNTSVEQLFFVLDLYSNFGRVSEKLTKVSKSNGPRTSSRSFGEKLMQKIPSDTAPLQLLKEAIFDKECAPLFSLEIYGNIIGMFELNNLDLVVASPVEDYFIHIDDLTFQEKEEAEKLTKPFLDALGDEYSVCCQGTAFFPLQSCMNHSCQPNAKAFKRDEDRDGQATIIALRPISIGEEVTISYIDEDLPYEERRAQLVDYGFSCRCPKCLAEQL